MALTPDFRPVTKYDWEQNGLAAFLERSTVKAK